MDYRVNYQECHGAIKHIQRIVRIIEVKDVTQAKHHTRNPIITSFYSPTHSDYQFKAFYTRLKEQGFVIYPGKVSNADCFRIGNIGEVYPADIERLIGAIEKAMYWQVA